jgi:fatty acid-binding protein DegV
VIGLCTDSSAQLPQELVQRFGVEVVPVTVRIGDREYLEGVDLDADEFYEHLARADVADVEVVPPSPGQFALAYECLAERGATEILSLHAGAGPDGMLAGARLAARHSPVPVRLVDTAMTGFAAGCCVWAAAEVVAAGGGIDDAVQRAQAVPAEVGNVFVVHAAQLLALAGGPADPARDAVPVLSLVDGEPLVLGRASCIEETADLMASYAVGWRRNGVARPLKVGLGIAASTAAPVRAAVEERLRAVANVVEIVHYRVGPAIAVRTGPGTASAFFYPA